MEMKFKFLLVVSFFVLGFTLLGINDVKAVAPCSVAEESCMKTVADPTSSTGFRNPPGFECTFRNVCPGGAGTACCKPVAATTATTSATTPAANGGNGANINTTASDCPPCDANNPGAFCNPLRFCSVESFLTNVLVTLRQIIVLLSLVFVVIGALFYVTSAGDSGRIETAKKAISASMIGLALGIAAPSFLKEVGGVLGWGSVNNAAVAAAPTLSAIATNVLSFLLSILGVLAMIMLVIGSVMYLTSAGDEDRIDTGKKIFKYALFGVIMAMASLVLVKQIALFFV